MRESGQHEKQGRWSTTKSVMERLGCPGLVQCRRYGWAAPRGWRYLPRREIQPRWMRAGRRVLAG